jgi:hypothetical protein
VGLRSHVVPDPRRDRPRDADIENPRAVGRERRRRVKERPFRWEADWLSLKQPEPPHGMANKRMVFSRTLEQGQAGLGIEVKDALEMAEQTEV